MSATDTVALVETKHSLTVESLNALHIVSVNWSSVRFIKSYKKFYSNYVFLTHLSRSFHQISSGFRHVHQVVFHLFCNISGRSHFSFVLKETYTL
jgi:hypothetical protein